MKFQVIIVTVTLFGYACAANYKRGYSGVYEKAIGNRHRRDASGGYEGGKNYPPKPYRFGYSVQDGQGNSHFRHEYSDQDGTVRGSYGYNDVRGLFRRVDYIADAAGYRANVETNEPGAVNIKIKQPASGSGGRFDQPPTTKELTDAALNTKCDSKNRRQCFQEMGAG